MPSDPVDVNSNTSADLRSSSGCARSPNSQRPSPMLRCNSTLPVSHLAGPRTGGASQLLSPSERRPLDFHRARSFPRQTFATLVQQGDSSAAALSTPADLAEIKSVRGTVSWG